MLEHRSEQHRVPPSSGGPPHHSGSLVPPAPRVLPQNTVEFRGVGTSQGSKRKRRTEPLVLLLSWFDGVGTMAWAITQLGITLWNYVSWENDADAQQLLVAHFPRIIQRGAYEHDTVPSILELVHSLDPPDDLLVLLVGAPPCTDHSRTRQSNAPGHRGTEGKKIIDFCHIVREIQHAFPWRTKFVLEHVLPRDPKEAQIVSAILGIEPVVADPVDVGPNRRPRAWWTDFDLSNDQSIRWGRYDSYHRFFLPGRKLQPKEMDLGDWSFHPKILDGSQTYPTLLTPAPTQEGGPPPKDALRTCSPSTVERWKRDRQ